MNERQKASDDYWKNKRFLSDKVIAGKLIMDGHTEATEQDFINADNLAKSNLSLGGSDYWRKNLEETGKTMAGLYGSFDSSMIKEEDLTDENGERYKKYTTNVFGKKSLVVRKNKPIVPADKTSVQLPKAPNNLPVNVNLPKPQNQIQPGQIPAMNAKLSKTAENMATASQASNDMSNNLSVNENLRNVPANIFNHVPIGPDNKEEIIRENIKEAKRLKNLPLDGLEKFKGLSNFDNFSQERQYLSSMFEKYATFHKYVKKHGIWDYKDGNSEFEDFGNFHYGIVGAVAGIPDQVLLRLAGWAHKRDNKDVPKEYGSWYDTDTSSSYGDDPKDQAQIKAGIEWYNKKKGHFK